MKTLDELRISVQQKLSAIVTHIRPLLYLTVFKRDIVLAVKILNYMDDRITSVVYISGCLISYLDKK